MRTTRWRGAATVTGAAGTSMLGRRVVSPSGLARRDDGPVGKCRGPRCRRDGRLAVVGGSLEGLVAAGSLELLGLRGYWREMTIPGGGLFLRAGAGSYAAGAAVIADIVDGLVRHVFVINIADVHDVDIGHRAVVEVVSSVPAPADEARAEIAETVNDSAVESNMRTPVALVEDEKTIAPTPVGRSPEVASFGSQYPGARHPIVILAIPSPIARCPDIAVAGANRLRIHRKGWRTE